MLWMVSASVSPSLAQETDSTRLDFNHCFEILRKNRVVYNQYNDSIFLIHDHAKWVDFFRRRAIVNHHIYDENRAVIQSLKRYFQDNGDSIPVYVYMSFFENLQDDYVLQDKSDPFMLQSVSNMLDNGGKNLPDSLKSTNVIQLWRLFSYIQMWNLGGDVAYLKKAYQSGLFLLSDEAKKYPYYDYALGHALIYLPRTWWLVFHIQTIDEYKAFCRRLDEYLARPDLGSILSQDVIDDLRKIQHSDEESLVRNTYLVDSTTMDKQEAFAIMRKLVDRNLAEGRLSSLSAVRTSYMQMVLGDISAATARKKSLERYDKVWKQIKNKRLTARQLTDFLQPFYTFFYLNHMARIPEETKRKTVLRMCKDIEWAYQNRVDQQLTTDYVRDLSRLSTEKYVTCYLTPKQYVRFLYSLNVATQVTTYAHSVHVAKIADVLMKGIFKYQPELLRGMLGCNTRKEVLAHKRRLRKFIHDACMYHDLGKNSIISVVNDEYRPLTDAEFEIVKMHSRFGMKYLQVSPELHKFYDTTLGHHKWYNGKGGYPEDFDNTKSPIRTLIDIVTLSDCIQAATEKIGRNYRYGKSSDVVMEELRKGAGTQYNPQLVALIDHHHEVRKEIDWLVADGWLDIYYDIYRKYFR